MGKKKELFDNEIRKAQKELYDIEKRFLQQPIETMTKCIF